MEYSTTQSFSMQHYHKRIPKNYFEKAAWENQNHVIGIDEVGRGCLAGPLVTAAVILPPGTNYRLLKDSKLLTKEEREQAYRWIVKHCQYSIGIVHNRIIDQHNLWHATLIAMKKAVIHLLASSRITPECILVDAMPLSLSGTAYTTLPIHYFPFGEQRSASIAAASIVAKVRRDALLNRLEHIFPGYDLSQHKGYRTPGHKKALKEHQTSLIIHRSKFLKPELVQEPYAKQQTLC